MLSLRQRETLKFSVKRSHSCLPEQLSPETFKLPLEYVHVDDIEGSKETSEKAKQITKDNDAILLKGQFQIKACHSSSKELCRAGYSWDEMLC